MNKGLEILKDIKERLVNMVEYVTEHNDTLRIEYCLKTNEDFERYVDNIIGVKIIEKELKDFECLDNFFQKIKTKYGIDDLDYLGHICSQYEALKKKEKALEIIKRTAMKLVSLEDDTTICKKGRYAFYDSELYQSVDLTQEEYDLLKEVML